MTYTPTRAIFDIIDACWLAGCSLQQRLAVIPRDCREARMIVEYLNQPKHIYGR